MSTNVDEPIALSTMFSMLDDLTRDIPISTVLDELQLVVERVSFSGIYELKNQSSQAVFTELDLYFEEEVSLGMMQFIRWFASKARLRSLANEDGRSLLEYCVIEYRKIQEIRFVSAIQFTEEEKLHTMSKLRTQFPEPARIIFDTAPSLMAGFRIEAGDEVVDASLRSHVNSLIARGVQLGGVASAVGASHG